MKKKSINLENKITIEALVSLGLSETGTRIKIFTESLMNHQSNE